MKDSRPNILLLMTDQQRGDCLGIEDHQVLQTPHLDLLAATGARFRNAYSACPVCIPARRTLMTGKRPVSHGVFMNYNTFLEGPTLPGKLSEAGYQAHLVGKLHLWPHRKLYGFDSADWADSPHELASKDDDYMRFLAREGVSDTRPGLAYGASWNGWVSRPWHLDERLHFSNWCAQSALDFLDRRDPTVPFFLKVSFHQPHQPCTPPQMYWDRYINKEMPDPPVGDWARVFDTPPKGQPIDSWRTYLRDAELQQYRAGYLGTVNHIDDQIGRILREIPENTLVLFISDHGDMLGDHQWIRKRNAFEGSARIPFLLKAPPSMEIPAGQVRDEVVEIMDVMPTCLDAAGVDCPATVDGRSVFDLLKGGADWRSYVHGECSQVPSLESGMQYLTDGKRKYIWYPGTGDENFFDLETDREELHDLSELPKWRDELQVWRKRLVRELEGRPEGFTDAAKLTPVGGPTKPYLPGLEQESFLS